MVKSIKVKSIKAKIILLLSVLVMVVSVLMGIASCVLNFRTAVEVMEETITDTATTAANQTVAALQSVSNIALETGSVKRLSDKDVSQKEKQALISQKIETYDFQSGGIIDQKD